ncbi:MULTISPECIES: ribonuclease H-like domain-containing protein [unclassified Microbacterium]|uniref:ribonuclease H-like domain-containing protein n=1 Tax=unclassified Microbacterium TaxID=2609290 RepID=UPI00301A75FA
MSFLNKLHTDVRRARILTLDIETKPALSRHFGMFNQNFSLTQVVEPLTLLSFAAKWLGESTVHHFSEWEHGADNMVTHAHQLLSEADVVVWYNGDGFDMKHLNWEFARLGMSRPKPYKTIDLLKVVRREFRPLSKKLDFVAQQLGLGSKTHHDGFGLWMRVIDGDEKSRRLMERYCIQDVRLTEKLYLRLLPWLPAGVNLPLIAGNDTGCPVCGSPELKSEGDSTFTALTEYALYSCQGCGNWVRSNIVKNRTTRRIVR